LCLFATSAHSQEQADSTSVDQTLKEFVFEGYSSHVEPGKTCYVPSAKAIKAAPDGIQLLRLMNLPTINVNPQTYEVSSINGTDISYFINERPANIFEVIALQPKEIKSIEYMESPNNPKFEGAQTAINYVIVEYIYGGYTKTSASLSAPEYAKSGYIYSKFKYKDFTYDVNVNGKYSSLNHDFQNSTEHFVSSNLSRAAITDKSKNKERSGNAALRMLYSTEKVEFSNMLGLGLNNLKSNSSITEVLSPGDSEERCTSDSERMHYISWTTKFNMDIGKMWSIHAAPTIQYSQDKDNVNLDIPDLISYKYGAMEHSSAFGFKGGAIKRLNSANSLYLNYQYSRTNNSVAYNGDIDSNDKFITDVHTFLLGYSYQNQHFYIVPDLGFCHYYDKINGLKTVDQFFNANLTTQYAFSPKHALTLRFQYNTLAPGVNEKNEELVRNDRFIYFSGNEKTSNYRIYQASLTYTFLPSPCYYGVLFTSTEYNDNRIVYGYRDFTDGCIVRTPQNSGSYTMLILGLKNNVYMFDRSLSLSLSPTMTYEKSTGLYAKDLYSFKFNLSATYYIRSLFFNIFYTSTGKGLSSIMPAVTKFYDSYGIYTGWSNNSWNINLSINNFLRYNWKYAVTKYSSQVYNFTSDLYSGNSHANVTLSVTYNINHGKRLRTSDEIENLSAPNSAIGKY
jgi:hypothetical protein